MAVRLVEEHRVRANGQHDRDTRLPENLDGPVGVRAEGAHVPEAEDLRGAGRSLLEKRSQGEVIVIDTSEKNHPAGDLPGFRMDPTPVL